MARLLIVEDAPLNVDLLVQLLEDDYELVVATDGEAGLAHVATARPDLVLLDISLPKMDGYEVAQRIKADPALQGTIVIGLSAHAMDGDREKALAAGCDAYLTKPLDEDLLFATLDRFLNAAPNALP
jgi:CheY-like chemotaxis protein